MKRIGLVATVASAVLVLQCAARAATSTTIQWGQFQKDARHNAFAATGIAPPLKRLWTFRIPDSRVGSAGGVVTGDTAIAVGEKAVYGVDLETGEMSWNLPRAGGPVTLPAVAEVGGRTVLALTEVASDGRSQLVTTELGATGPKRSPAFLALDDTSTSGVTVDGNVAYLGDRAGRVYAVDLSTNETVWKSLVAGGRIEAPPAVGDGLVVVVGRDGDTGEVRVVGLDAGTGKEKWLFSPSFAVDVGSGVTLADGRVFFGMGDVEVHAVSADTGKEVWSTRVRSQFSPFVAPAYGDGQLYIVGTSGTESALYRLGAPSGDRPWDFEFTSEDLRSSPVVVEDAVYVGLGDGTLAEINRHSGVEIGEEHTGPGALGALAVTGDVLIAGKRGPQGGLVAFGPDPEGHLIHVLSPTHLRLRHVLVNFAIAFAGVFLALFLGFRGIARVRGSEREPAERWEPSDLEGTEATEAPREGESGPPVSDGDGSV